MVAKLSCACGPGSGVVDGSLVTMDSRCKFDSAGIQKYYIFAKINLISLVNHF
jgi:hypothetical protein